MKLKDPCKLDAQKAAVESAMLGSPSKRSTVKLGKDTLPVEQWATGKIEATPYGTFAKMMDSSGGEKKASKMNPTRQSNIVLDDFNYPRGKLAVDAEMPRGKRIFPTLVYADPSSEYGGTIKF
jgi:hypothetical protein